MVFTDDTKALQERPNKAKGPFTERECMFILSLDMIFLAMTPFFHYIDINSNQVIVDWLGDDTYSTLFSFVFMVVLRIYDRAVLYCLAFATRIGVYLFFRDQYITFKLANNVVFLLNSFLFMVKKSRILSTFTA